MEKGILITGTVMNADNDSTKIYEDIVQICKKINTKHSFEKGYV